MPASRSAQTAAETCAATLAVAAGQVVGVRLDAPGFRRVRTALIGRPLAEAPRLARRLFPVCAIAQEIACTRAAEAAAGHAPDPATEHRRTRLLDAEAAVAHVWRAAIDWPRWLGRAPTPGPAKAARAALAAVEAALAARLGDRRALPADPPLGPRAAAWFAARLAPDPDFAARPEAEGAPADPLPGHRAAGGLGARLDALRAGAAALAARLRDAPGPASAAGAWAHAGASGTGCGVAMTARGPLACLLRADAGRVADLRAVAPTEWVMHPHGALARALATLFGGAIADEARALIAVFDPCAEVAVTLRETADA